MTTSLASLIAPLPTSALGLYGLGNVTPLLKWIAVRQRFQQFQNNLGLTSAQTSDGLTKYRGVVDCLNRWYYNLSSESDHGFWIGSWGKRTAIRPPGDLDMYFVLPYEVYSRFSTNTGNIQSTLLQEVKYVLSRTYPRTDMRGDGQVIVVRFDSISVEVVPAFRLQNDRYWICATHNGGSWKETDPWAEVNAIKANDSANANNLRPIIMMLKAWKTWCSVPIKSFQIELLAASFLNQSAWRLKDYFYYDWIIRDFFAYLYHQANQYVFVPGTFEPIFLGNDWQSRAESAYYRAAKACEYEADNLVVSAGDEWQKIFGLQIPRMA